MRNIIIALIGLFIGFYFGRKTQPQKEQTYQNFYHLEIDATTEDIKVLLLDNNRIVADLSEDSSLIEIIKVDNK